MPETDGNSRGGDLEGQCDQPAESIIPAHGKTPSAVSSATLNGTLKDIGTLPGRVNEAHAVLVEGAVDRIQNRQLSQRLDGAEQHDPDNAESNY